MSKLPSQEYLQSRIDYNPETGEVRWKPVDESYGPCWKRFNTLYANTVATRELITLQKVRVSKAKVIYKLLYNEDPKFAIRFIDGDSNNLKANNIALPRISTAKCSKALSTVAITLPSDASDYLEYNHINGKLLWKTRSNKTFNTRFAGKEAGSVDTNWYSSVSLNNTQYKSHRLAWFLYYGVDPGKYMIDHVNKNKHDNSIVNLRLANYSLNNHLAKQDSAKGWRIENNKYAAYMHIGSLSLKLGTYDTEVEARTAYEAALQKYKPIYQFTESEQAMLDELYNTYPNCDPALQRACHDLQVKALNYYIEGVQ